MIATRADRFADAKCRRGQFRASSISPVVSPDHPGARGDLRLSEQEIVNDHVPPSAGEPQSNGPSCGRTIVAHEASGDSHALDIFQEQSTPVAVENRASGHVDPPTAPQNQGTQVGQGIEDPPWCYFPVADGAGDVG
ncbi:MAG: hypothetical protein NTY19_51285 [Planctomycetota bacterium]|nr:hypothetical protein [Planctomycetota bacterium]